MKYMHKSIMSPGGKGCGGGWAYLSAYYVCGHTQEG